jgi:hypothetical protein
MPWRELHSMPGARAAKKKEGLLLPLNIHLMRVGGLLAS